MMPGVFPIERHPHRSDHRHDLPTNDANDMASIDLNGDDGPSAGDHNLTTHRASSPVGPSDV
jgi:hypothetical protein